MAEWAGLCATLNQAVSRFQGCAPHRMGDEMSDLYENDILEWS